MKFVTDFVFLVASMSIGTLIDRVGSGGFEVTGRDRTGGNLAMDKGGGWAEV